MSSISLRWVGGSVQSSADVVLTLDGRDFCFRTTYIGDGLGSVVQSALDLAAGSSSAIAVLPAEPQGVRLFFSDANMEAYLQVVEFPDLWTGKPWSGGRLLWAGRIDVGAYVRAIVRLADSVIDAFGGVEEYERVWSPVTFPSRKVLALRGHVGGSEL